MVGEGKRWTKIDQLISQANKMGTPIHYFLLYPSDAPDEKDSVNLGGRRTIKKKISV